MFAENVPLSKRITVVPVGPPDPGHGEVARRAAPQQTVPQDWHRFRDGAFTEIAVQSGGECDRIAARPWQVHFSLGTGFDTPRTLRVTREHQAAAPARTLSPDQQPLGDEALHAIQLIVQPVR